MSRIGKKPIQVPAGVEVSINAGSVSVKGPKGMLHTAYDPSLAVAKKNDTIVVTVADPKKKKASALWGLTRALIQNMIHGVTDGFSKTLEINGVGYKIAVQGSKVVLHVGFSHPVEYTLPAGVEAKVEINTIALTGADRQLVGQVASEIRSIRKPEPYKGKGIKYSDEVIRRKEGKVVKSAGA